MLAIDPTVAILGTGSAVPERRVTNAELRGLVGGYDDSSGDFATWVDRVTHIQERRWIDPNTDGVQLLATEAARKAVESSGVPPAEIDHVIFASFTYDDLYPGVHAWLSNELGLSGGSFYLTAACSGSLWALTMARSLVQSGQCRNVLVIGTECMSRVTDFNDPLTAILFGDAAGAAVIGRKDDGEDTGFIGQSVLTTEYSRNAIAMTNANIVMGCTQDKNQPMTLSRSTVSMSGGPRVMKSAVRRMAGAVCEVLGFTSEDLKQDNPQLREVLSRAKIIPHQANGRIVDGLQDRLKLPKEQVYKTIYLLGNSSAATNMVTLDHGIREGNLYREPPPEGSNELGRILPCGETIKKGDLVVLVAIGAGYLYGAIAFKHAY